MYLLYISSKTVPYYVTCTFPCICVLALSKGKKTLEKMAFHIDTIKFIKTEEVVIESFSE